MRGEKGACTAGLQTEPDCRVSLPWWCASVVVGRAGGSCGEDALTGVLTMCCLADAEAAGAGGAGPSRGEGRPGRQGEGVVEEQERAATVLHGHSGRWWPSRRCGQAWLRPAPVHEAAGRRSRVGPKPVGETPTATPIVHPSALPSATPSHIPPSTPRTSAVALRPARPASPLLARPPSAPRGDGRRCPDRPDGPGRV